MALIHALIDDLHEVVDDAFADRIAVQPTVKGQYGALPDPARPGFEVVGQLRMRGGVAALKGRGPDLRSSAPALGAEVQVRVALLPAGFEFRSGDLVTAPDQPGAPRFEVVRAEPQLGLAVVQLNRIR